MQTTKARSTYGNNFPSLYTLITKFNKTKQKLFVLVCRENCGNSWIMWSWVLSTFLSFLKIFALLKFLGCMHNKVFCFIKQFSSLFIWEWAGGAFTISAWHSGRALLCHIFIYRHTVSGSKWFLKKSFSSPQTNVSYRWTDGTRWMLRVSTLLALFTRQTCINVEK